MNLAHLALTDPDALAAMLADPATEPRLLSWGAECLGARWTPDRWWPTIKLLLRHKNIVVRETALIGLAGEQTEPEEPVGATPPGFYAVRDWPVDLAPEIRDEVIAEMTRIIQNTEEPLVIRGLAAHCFAQIRCGDRYPEVEILAEHPGAILTGVMGDGSGA